MFAVALWDARTSTLHLLRDHFGIKPLYYAALPGGIVFGSEIKAILASRLTGREMSWRAFHEYLYYGNSLGAETFFEGIRKLEPGHHLTLTETGATVRAYWTPDSIVPVDDPPEVAARTVLRKLDAAVESHLVSDVPVGVFLSGGIDSSAIATLAQRHHAGRLRTYSVGFDFDRGPDELPAARRLAERLGTDHHELRLAGGDMPAVIERLIDAHDVPFDDAANIPLALLCNALKGDVTVVLQGDGGDEMFAGYRGYDFLARAALWRRISPLGLLLTKPLPESRRRHGLRRVFGYLARSDPGMRMALMRFDERIERLPTRIFTRNTVARLRRHDPFARYLQIGRRFGHLDALQAMLYADSAVLLPDKYLEKVDRATMAYGIESRVPYLDDDLAAYALALPSSLKVRRGQKKWVLRRALRWDGPRRDPRCPEDRLQRPRVALAAWPAEPLPAGDATSHRGGRARPLRPGRAQAMHRRARLRPARQRQAALQALDLQPLAPAVPAIIDVDVMSEGHVSSPVADSHAPAGRARILGDSDHRILLRLGDTAAAAVAVAGSLLIWSLVQGAPFTPAFVAEHAVWFVLVVPWMLLLLPAHRPGTMFSVRATATAAARAAVTGAMLYFAVFFLAPRGLLARLVVVYFLALAFSLTLAWRFVYVQAFTRALRRTPVAIVRRRLGGAPHRGRPADRDAAQARAGLRQRERPAPGSERRTSRRHWRRGSRMARR